MRYYPTEFIAAMLNSVKGDSDKVAYYTRFAKDNGIEVLPPDINESYTKFTVSGNKIRFGLSALKNAGDNVIESIVNSREEKGKFTDLGDFCTKIDLSVVNKRVVESLIKSGALDSFKVFRSRMLAVYEKILDGINSERKRNIAGQLNLFMDFEENKGMEIAYPNIKEFDKKYLLAMEKEMTGLYITGHPLEEYENSLETMTNTRISDIVSEEMDEELAEKVLKVRDGDKVILGGIITSINKKVTKKNEMMAFIVVEDLYASIEVILFPKTFEKYKGIITEDAVIVIKGRVNIREEETPKILCEDIEPLMKISNKKIYVQIENSKMLKAAENEIRNVSFQYKGGTAIYLCTKEERKMYMMSKEFWISEENEAIEALKKKFGAENVKMI